MPEHRFPLQLECLTLAVQSTTSMVIPEDLGEDDVTKMILKRASAFLGWAQSTTPTRRINEELRPHPRPIPLGDPTESPVR